MTSFTTSLQKNVCVCAWGGGVFIFIIYLQKCFYISKQDMTAQCGHSSVVNIQPLKVHNGEVHTPATYTIWL